jgi:signal transduction histidine kinase
MAGAKRLRFSAPLEAQFRDEYFDQSIVLSRAALAALMLMWMAFGVLDIYALPLSLHGVWLIRFGIVLPIWFVVLAWSFHPSFRGAMQIAMALLVFAGGSAITAMTAIARPSELGHLLYYSGLILAPLCGYSFLRLRFWYATGANVAVAVIYLLSALYVQQILQAPQGPVILINNLFFVVGANIAGMATCYSLEFSARRAFIATYLLEQDRLGEQRKRESTEAMLQVLSQAIGGVVHDLGNPLTSVQSGLQTLEMVLAEAEPDPELVDDLVRLIGGGAQMLNALRLSLMEQTRVLEGKPTPVDLHHASIRPILETAARHQNPRYRADRAVSIRGADCEIDVDEMKLITVFMNLIGNAFKYSDGEVSIQWRSEAGHLLIAISDQGLAGQGITQLQAEQLFIAFGRLDSHAGVEGTGLGLLSVRHIVAAHSGEVFIEGSLDGSPDSPWFSTAQGQYSPMLSADFRTAFVVACPQEVTTQ